MCYICRQDIKKEAYAHFCPHFRPLGGECTECKKCNLWQKELDIKIVKEAGERAKIEWLKKNPDFQND